MKRSFITLLLSIFIIVPVPVPAFAQTTEPTSTASPTTAATTPTSEHGKNLSDLKGKLEAKITQRAENKDANQADRLTTLKKKADDMIQKRIEALNKITTRITNDKNLSSDEKTTLTTEINGVITGLNT